MTEIIINSIENINDEDYKRISLFILSLKKCKRKWR